MDSHFHRKLIGLLIFTFITSEHHFFYREFIIKEKLCISFTMNNDANREAV